MLRYRTHHRRTYRRNQFAIQPPSKVSFWPLSPAFSPAFANKYLLSNKSCILCISCIAAFFENEIQYFVYFSRLPVIAPSAQRVLDAAVLALSLV